MKICQNISTPLKSIFVTLFTHSSPVPGIKYDRSLIRPASTNDGLKSSTMFKKSDT